MRTILIKLIIFQIFFKVYGFEGDKETCKNAECVIRASTMDTYMNYKVNPCDNFYDYVCGNYIKNTIIHDRYGENGVRFDFKNKMDEKLRNILTSDELLASSAFRKIKTFYKDCIDVNKLNEIKAAPLMAKILELGGWPLLDENWKEETFDWQNFIDRMYQLGFVQNFLIDFFLSPDPENPQMYIAQISQVIGAHYHKGYYQLLKYGRENAKIKAYYDYMVDFTTLLGASKEKAQKEMLEVLEFETSLTSISNIPNDVDEEIETLKSLQDKNPDINWRRFLTARFGEEAFTDVNARVMTYGQMFFGNISGLINKTPKRVLANFLFWRIIDYSKHYLANELKQPALKFYEKVYGILRLQQGWQRCVGQAKRFLGPALAALLARKEPINHFDQIDTIIQSVRNEAVKIIEKSRVADNDIKAKLSKEIAEIEIIAQYPSEYFNDSVFEQFYMTADVNDGEYFETVLKLERFKSVNYGRRILKSIKETRWSTFMDGSFDESIYSNSKNFIFIHPAELQYPYYNKNLPDYVNFAGLGSRIALFYALAINYKMELLKIHEHMKYFKCIRNQYSKFILKNFNITAKANEAILQSQADNLSFILSYRAYKAFMKTSKNYQPSLPGLNFSGEQFFWITISQQWCHIIRNKEIVRKTIMSDFPIEPFRVIGPLQNNEKFSKDFNCDVETEMNPLNKCK